MPGSAVERKNAELDLPVAVGGQYVLKADGMNHDGEGVGSVEGFTLFVPGLLPGEEAEVRVEQVKKRFGRASIVRMRHASPERTEPPCPIYAACGGCQLQHASYAEQLRIKRNLVVSNLERIGKLRTTAASADVINQEANSSEHGVIVHPVLGMQDAWRYRNKIQVPFGEREGGLVAGFYEKGSHAIIDMEDCLITDEAGGRLSAFVKKKARELGIPAYREASHTGVLRHVIVRIGSATGEKMVVLITNGEALPHQEALVQALVSEIEGMASICQNVNTAKGSRIFGETTKVLWGRDVIYDRIGDIRFAISPLSFYQVNPVQTEVLYRKALAYADLSGDEIVVDAYCGIGTISLFLAQHAREVYGVEVLPEAIEDAKANAVLNGIANVRFETGQAEEVLPRWHAEGIRPDVIVVDPPRAGCDPALLDTIIAMKPQRIVYVSCDPATLARDLHRLEDGGFRTVEVQPVDMFPHTVHVETVSLLIYKGFE